MIRRPPRSPLFPYTPLSRSVRRLECRAGAELDVQVDHPARPRAARPQRVEARHAPRAEGEDLLADRVELLRRQRLVDEDARSEEHTSELQSPCNLVCRLLLE